MYRFVNGEFDTKHCCGGIFGTAAFCGERETWQVVIPSVAEATCQDLTYKLPARRQCRAAHPQLLTVNVDVTIVVPPPVSDTFAVIEWLPLDRLAVLYGVAVVVVPPAKSQGAFASVQSAGPVAVGLSR
jgi:hypothetical protein